METKQNIRKRILALRDGLSQDRRLEQDRRILEALRGSERYTRAGTLLCYVSFQNEADTGKLLEQALLDGKQVYCPRVEGREMEFYRISSMDSLTPGFRGIMEPFGNWPETAGRLPETAERFAPEALGRQREPLPEGTVLMILPGIAFDVHGRRIGYGGGYYDRYLRRCAALLKNGTLCSMAIAYDLQVLERIPEEPQDVRPQNIITESNCYPVPPHDIMSASESTDLSD